MTTDQEKAALAACRILGDAINARAVSDDNRPPEAVLCDFAKAHRIETLLSSALRQSGIPDDAYLALHRAADTAAFHQVKKDLVSAALLHTLAAHGVQVLPLKGAALQAVYPDGWVRTTTDVDWYVLPAQYPLARKLLTDNGFTPIADHDGESAFHKPPRHVIELHTTLGGFSEKQKDTLARLAAQSFTVNEHYVYAVFHLYKHFLYAGAGVRLFLDVYLLSRAVTDRDTVERWLRELGLLPFDRAVHTVCGILFDRAPCTDTMHDVIGLVLRCGTFGTGETYHAIKKATRPLMHNNRVRVWLTDYGFDRHAMCVRYPVLKRCILLYPFLAVHRIVRGAIYKRAVVRHAVEATHAIDRSHMEHILKAMQIL